MPGHRLGDVLDLDHVRGAVSGEDGCFHAHSAASAAETVVARPSAPISLPIRDPDDGWILASAIAGKADMLVTGDQDLLDIAGASPVPIMDPRGCWERLRGVP
jgi:predicted nucleic acid-binding protein